MRTVQGVTWHSLQVGPKAAAECPAGAVSHRLADWHDTAALIAGLDLVVAVDTAVANLAGARGKRVFVLHQAADSAGFDPRWGVSGMTTPWFPSARVFRQGTAGEWGPVIERVRSSAAQLAT